MRAVALARGAWALALLLAAPAAWAGDTGVDACQADAITTQDINDCAQADLDRAEAELNATYRRIRAHLAAPECGAGCARTRELLTQAQRSWVAYRKSDCDAAWQYNADGTIRTVVYLTCMSERARTRTRELELLLAPDA
ncbi:lysozyme inhibitor LprI family protein [Marilutibacter spongiae]|uniref:DUF1311 domain-containing protein n=1 Tax=Marilutibacter spongiae TaxID=2025720 RepID=A0A7W3Y6Y1_9GAMM|nr:lysozyme inhibitor LprI family protein [Lysobacter spongiae]MBB1061712.1 DUF1311 domain-containing protein [Lysobacter spongiae]